MTQNALATIGRDEWSVMLEQAAMLVKTGFLPKDINTPEKALGVMMKGRELNIPPMHALATIVVIQGKPTVSPELMAALVERDYGSNALIVEETNSERCIVSCFKRGWDKRRTVQFTIDEAKIAGLLSNATWQKYPEAMLRSRAISKACKTHFQASIGGMLLYEEMGAVVNEDGSYEALAPAPETQGIVIHDALPRGAYEVINGDTGEIVTHGSPGEQAFSATPAQIKRIFAAGEEHGWTRDEIRDHMDTAFSKSSTRELTIGEASALIETIEGRAAPAESQQPALVG